MDLNKELVIYLKQELSRNPKFNVVLVHEGKNYIQEFQKYFKEEIEEIREFMNSHITKHKKKRLKKRIKKKL